MKLRDVIEAHKWSKKDGRNYDKERKYNDTPKARAYRAKLNKYNRDKGTYANDDGKDASHKGKEIVGFEPSSKNKGRREKSRKKHNWLYCVIFMKDIHALMVDVTYYHYTSKYPHAGAGKRIQF